MRVNVPCAVSESECSRHGTFRRTSAFLAAMSRHPSARNQCIAGLAMIVLLAGGCAAVPDVDEQIAEATSTSSSKPLILGADGRMQVAQREALAGHRAADAALERHLAIEQAIAGTPLTSGNAAMLLRDGEGTFAAVFEAIAGARHHINLEYYTLEDIEFGGRKLSAMLLEKRRAGVAVNIIYDSYGSSSTPAAFFEELEAAGARLLEYHPVNPLEAVAEGYSPNDRNHRKIAIVDGKVAILGGVNLATYYQSKTPGDGAGSGGDAEKAEKKDDQAPQKDEPDDWRDLSVRIEGPAVAQLQGLFLGHWHNEDGPPIDQSSFFPTLKAAGDQTVRIIGSSPEQDFSRYYVTLISAIRSAQERIWLTTAYFVPTFEEKQALIAAAERGVDVRLMLPAVSDASQAVAVAHSHYGDLLEAGVRIFEIEHVILHSKTVTIDGVWSAIGSSNFDHRSVLFNDEVEAIVLGRKTAADLEKVFEGDQAEAREIDLAAWSRRPLTDRVTDFFQRGLQHLL